jgi:hypothetical protein
MQARNADGFAFPLKGSNMRSTASIACLMVAYSVAGAHSATFPPSSDAAAQAATRSPFLAATAGEFAADCQKNQGGCADVIGEVLLDRILYAPVSHICLPDENYPDNVPSWLLAHPETSNMETQDGIHLAITNLYRCEPADRH